jgi:hypothetical protein
MAVFNERVPIPQKIEQQVKPDGNLGHEFPDARIAKEGITREVEADIVMNLSTAEAVHEWLGDKIKQLKSVLK